jgi:hypothetical protein
MPIDRAIAGRGIERFSEWLEHALVIAGPSRSSKLKPVWMNAIPDSLRKAFWKFWSIAPALASCVLVPYPPITDL